MGVVIKLPARSPSAGALTRHQLIVLRFMTDYAAAHDGAWPTKAQVRAACGLRPRLAADFIVNNLVSRNALPSEAALAG